jgi:hypothetical protein
MQLGPNESVAVIPAVDVDRATMHKIVEARRAELAQKAFAVAAKPGNPQALLRYLRRHTGIDLSRAVFQRGARNYAGPNCPGPAWNCTTARQVVQIVTRATGDDDNGHGGGNTFRCTADPMPDTTCTVLQISHTGTGSNRAECVQRQSDSPVVVQECTITQSTMNGSNWARIEQDVNRHDSIAAQDVFQSATVMQTTTHGDNHVEEIVQDVDLVMSGSSPQMQDAHQKAELDMITSDGNNAADVVQTQDLNAHATALVVDQRQNTELDSVANCAFGQEPQEPNAPNSCASIFMNTQDGNNWLDLDQRNDLEMTVPGGGEDDDHDDHDDHGGGSSHVSGSEQQGSCNHAGTCVEGNDADGGTEAGIDMFGHSGTTTSHMTGSAIQDMPDHEPLIDQLQFADPFCCYDTFFVNESARADVELLVDQDAGEGAYQAGENGLGCIVEGGNCNAELVISNNEDTFRAEGSGPILFAYQDCRYFPPEEGPSILQDGCAEVGFTTTTETGTS